eukprot:1088565-Rhodomonas_salina.4
MALTTVGLQFEKTRADVIAALPKKKHTCVLFRGVFGRRRGADQVSRSWSAGRREESAKADHEVHQRHLPIPWRRARRAEGARTGVGFAGGGGGGDGEVGDDDDDGGDEDADRDVSCGDTSEQCECRAAEMHRRLLVLTEERLALTWCALVLARA